MNITSLNAKREIGVVIVMSNIIELKQPAAKSNNAVLNTLKTSIQFARHNEIVSTFTVLVDKEGVPYINVKCKEDHEAIQDLLFAIQSGHEVVYNIGKIDLNEEE